jgi:PhnB protein
MMDGIMKSTTTYLHFSGNCREAMAFYRECFGGELEVMAYPEAGGSPNTDPAAPVMHSRLARGEQSLLMASDYPPGTDTSGHGSHFSVYVDCSGESEVADLFGALSQGGKATMPPSDMPFGRFAMCDDAFGTSWILLSAKGG